MFYMYKILTTNITVRDIMTCSIALVMDDINKLTTLLQLGKHKNNRHTHQDNVNNI